MLDEVAPEILFIAGAGTVIVCGMMVLVWFVSTREEKAKNKKKDEDKEMDVSGGKQVKRKKQQPNSPRKRKETTKEEQSTETVVESSAKSILKDPKEEPSPKPPQHVEFHKEAMKSKPTGNRVNPSTPHPQSGARLLNKDSESGGSDDAKLKTATAKEEKKQTHSATSQPPRSTDTKPVASQQQKVKATAKPTDSSVAQSPSDQLASTNKKKAKSKQPPITEGDLENLSGFQFANAIANSSLSQDDVEMIMERLLEKKDLDDEWEMTNRTDSIKVLKKNNTELHTRCSEAERTVQQYSARIKELSQELRQDKTRHTATENSLQGLLAKLKEDNENMKGKLDRTLKDLDEMKKVDSEVEKKKLQEEHQSFQAQLAKMAEKNNQFTSELSKKDSEIATLKDTVTQLKIDIKSAKDSAKSQTDSKQSQQKVNELQGRLKQAGDEKDQMQKELMGLNDERAKLASKVEEQKKTIADLHQELENAQKVPVQEVMTVVEETGLTSTPPTTDNDEKVKELESELHQVKESLEKLRTENENGKKEKEQLVDKLKDQDSDIKKNSDIYNKIANENDQLRAVQKSLEEELAGVKESLALEKKASQALQTQVDSFSNGIDKEPNDDEDENGKFDDEQLEILKEKNQSLHRKIAELQNTNETLRETCFDAQQKLETVKDEWQEKLKVQQEETKDKVSSAIQKAQTDQQSEQKKFLTRLFPTFVIEGEDFDEWTHTFFDKVQEDLAARSRQLDDKNDEVIRLKQERDEEAQGAKQMKDVIKNSIQKFDELMAKWQEKESEYNDTISKLESSQKEMAVKVETAEAEAKAAKEEKEEYHRRFSETDQITLVTQQETETLRHSLNHEINIKEKLEGEVEELRTKLSDLENQVSTLTKDKESLEQRANEAEKESAVSNQKLSDNDTLIKSLREANQDLHTRLTSKFSPPPTHGTSSEV